MGKQISPVEDIITLSAGHSLMTGHLPEQIPLSKFTSEIYKAEKKHESIDSWGLFGSDLNYNTYYPDFDPKDLNLSEEEFINPVYRLLSEVVVARRWNPTDFSKNGVLKNSMPLLLGQTVNCDHETSVGNAIGSISKVEWQEGYTEKGIDGKSLKIPAGINGALKIDAKANPRVARGILMDPPSIHSNSVTIQFLWDKSHPTMDDDMFYSKLGSYDKKGELIRKIAVDIKRYMETSLVNHGADSFAKQIRNGKIVLPDMAAAASESYAELDNRASSKYYFFTSYKDLTQSESMFNTEIIQNNEQFNNQKPMQEELKAFLEALFGEGLLTLREGSEQTTEAALEEVRKILKENQDMAALKEENKALSEKVEELKELETKKEFIELGENTVEDLRKSTIENYRKALPEGVEEDAGMISLMESAKHASLLSLNKGYTKSLEEKFPLACTKCGSHEVARASSDANEPPKRAEDNKNSEVKGYRDALKDIAEKYL